MKSLDKNYGIDNEFITLLLTAIIEYGSVIGWKMTYNLKRSLENIFLAVGRKQTSHSFERC